ncbi:hypothetical protein [Streptomyces sp. SID3343]|uniref:hypothetical protein n=1 Tax=Streptomyces sp. SID3343 TaxID=2690260 RepID=UPI00136E40CB|nr:hypothetical protein [Streptomyces sp. SID3343]MYV99275.1 hypothetical protein [Streptomyces sp. SID3343]
MTDARTLAASRRARWWGPLAVIAVLALLTGGWPLIDSWISGDERVRAGTVFRVGPDSDDYAWFRIGDDGWTLDRAATTPSRQFVLRREGVDLSIAYISLARAEDADNLWTGLRDTVRVADPHARLGPPQSLIADAGAAGVFGTLVQDGDTGRAAIFRGPQDAFAIRLIALAAPGTPDPVWLPARDVMRSLTFTEEAA